MKLFDPAHLGEEPVIGLLRAAAHGSLGVDRPFIRAILERGETATAELLAFSRESHDKDPVSLDPVLVDLFRHFQSSDALAFYIDTLRRSHDDVDDSLIQALLPFGERAIAPLLELYEELGEEEGGEVAFLLAGLEVRDPRILDLLLERLEYDAGDGAFCLGLYGDPAARPALEKMLAEIPEQGDKEIAALRREVSYAIEQLGAEREPYVVEPFDILAQYPERALPEYEVLAEAERAELLASPDALTRAGAAHSFFNERLDPKTQKKLLDLAGSDPEAHVRGRAWEALGDATENDSIRDAMLAVLNDSRKPVAERGGAAVGLYAVADQDSVSRSVEALYEEGGAARAKALETMWRSLWSPYSKYFARHLDETDPAIAREALRGAGYFQLTGSADKIASFFDREGDLADLRDDALFAYALAMPGETTRGRVRGMLRKIDSLTGLTAPEAELVMFALDERLRLHGLDPVFAQGSPPETEPAAKKPGRNDPCPCGSGKKYKKCCGA